MQLIAEVGSNWRTSENLDTCWNNLLKLLDKLDGLTDFVKFQCWNTPKFVHKDHSSYEKYKFLEFPVDWYDKIIEEVNSRDMTFMSTPFDVDTADLLKIIGQKHWKIASGDITYSRLLQKIASYKEPVYISTGNTNEWEIEIAVNIIKHYSTRTPITLLHCISKYPTMLHDIGFQKLKDMISRYDTNVIGWSSHLEFDDARIAASVAATIGASVFEFHVRLDDNFQEYGLTPDEFDKMRQTLYTIIQQNRSVPEIYENGLLWDRRNEKDELRPWIETICKRDPIMVNYYKELDRK